MKIVSMQDAVARHVRDGATVAIEGFTAFICFAAAHEIIRQKRRNLTLCRMTPDLIYDQMVAAGCASKLVFSYLGNPGVGPLHCIRRAVEKEIPNKVEIEEYSHFGMICRYMAGAANLPFFPIKSYLGDDLPKVNPRITFVDSPYNNQRVAVVPPLNPDVAIIHAQRADKNGNTQLWGLMGTQKEIAFSAKEVVVVVEEIVDESVIRSDPNRTVIPGMVVHTVVEEPFGTHPSYVQGYQDRDNDFYLMWDKLSQDVDKTNAWIDEWVYGVNNRTDYMAKLAAREPGIYKRLAANEAYSSPVNYGSYK